MSSGKKTSLWIYLLIAVFVLGLGWVIYRKMTSVDWKESFAYTSTTPYGTQLFFKALPDFFETEKPEVVKESAFNRLIYDHQQNGLYVIVAPSLSIDSLDGVALKHWISKGNQVLIFTRNASPVLEKLGNFTFEGEYIPFTEVNKDTVQVWLGDTKTPAWHLPLKSNSYMKSKDTTGQEIFLKDNRNWSIGVKFHVGEGTCYVITRPEYASNYFLLMREAQDLMPQLLAELDAPDVIYWDEYYRLPRSQSNRPSAPPETSFLDYILSQPGLSGAFWLALVGLAIYLLLGSRRVQRLIPIILPRKNTSLEFAETIGRLYFREADHRNLALKRMRVWFDHLRNKYRIPANSPLDDKFQQLVALKTGADEATVADILRYNRFLQKQLTVDEATLVQISQELDLFYAQTMTGQKA